MNILVLSQRIPYPPNKGEKLRTYHQIKRLLGNGHSVNVCTPLQNANESALISGFESTLNIKVIHQDLGRPYLRMLKGFLLFKTLSISYFYSPKLLKKLNQHIFDHSYDVILCTSSSMAEYVFRSDFYNNSNNIQYRRIMLIMDFMDLDSDKWRQYSRPSSWPTNWIYSREAYLLSRYERRIQQEFDHCFLISQTEVDMFHNRIGDVDNIHVLGNGIDTESFYPPKIPPHNESPVFIFTGVMDYKPNIEAVLWFVNNAWRQIKKKYSRLLHVDSL